MWVQSLSELHDDLSSFEVLSSIDEFVKLIDILVDVARPLEILRCLQVRSRGKEFVLQIELHDELHDKFVPCHVQKTADCLIVSHMSGNEACSPVSLHERESLHDFSIIVHKLMRCKGHV